MIPEATPKYRRHLLTCLDRVERLARGSVLDRLRHAPFRYLRSWLTYRFPTPLRRRVEAVEVPLFFGKTMRILLPSALDIYALGAKAHDAELRLARFLIFHLQPDSVFVDAGAHFGYFSLLASACCPHGRVVALEASAVSFAVLQQNVVDFPQTSVHHLAVAESDGEVEFAQFPVYVSEYNTLDPTQYAQADWAAAFRPETVRLASRSLSSLFEREELQPSIIKIDVEGAEDRVIAGLVDYLSACPDPMRPLIVLECVNDVGHQPVFRRAATTLEQFGYRPHLILSDGRSEPIADVAASLHARGLDTDNVVFCPV